MCQQLCNKIVILLAPGSESVTFQIWFSNLLLWLLSNTFPLKYHPDVFLFMYFHSTMVQVPYSVKFNLKSMSVIKDFLTWLLFGWQLSCQPIRCQVWKSLLTHWGRAAHICAGNLTIIGSDNSLLSGQCQGIIWTNAGILLIVPLGTNFSEILIETHTFSLKKCIWKCRLENGSHFVSASMC